MLGSLASCGNQGADACLLVLASPITRAVAWGKAVYELSSPPEAQLRHYSFLTMACGFSTLPLCSAGRGRNGIGMDLEQGDW